MLREGQSLTEPLPLAQVISLFQLTASSYLAGIAADYLEDRGHCVESAALRAGWLHRKVGSPPKTIIYTELVKVADGEGDGLGYGEGAGKASGDGDGFGDGSSPEVYGDNDILQLDCEYQDHWQRLRDFILEGLGIPSSLIVAEH